VGPQGKVFSFEFDPQNLEIMNANLALNPALAERIEVIPAALWNRSGETLEFAQAGRMTTVRPAGDEAQANPASLRVMTSTLDDFVQQRGIDRIDFIKMDVEGAEPEVLAGAGEALARFAPKLGIAAYHRDDDLVRLPTAVVQADPSYRLYVDSFSPYEDETILFAASPRATSLSRRT
jgi:FkbM family methyltransferase